MFDLIELGIAVGVVISEALILLFLVGFIFKKDNPDHPLVLFLQKYGLFIAFVATFGSTVGSLYYSEIREFAPCTLCWFQRIVMYPQVILLGFGFLRKDFSVRFYCAIFSGIGLVIALYHSLLPFLGEAFEPCKAQAVSCTKIYVEYFGYITIPVMALSAFGLMLVATLFAKPAHESSR